jgi:hypothetical protein
MPIPLIVWAIAAGAAYLGYKNRDTVLETLDGMGKAGVANQKVDYILTLSKYAARDKLEKWAEELNDDEWSYLRSALSLRARQASSVEQADRAGDLLEHLETLRKRE